MESAESRNVVRGSYRNKRKVRLVPHYLIADAFSVSPKTISRLASRFGYDPYSATSLILFIQKLTRHFDNP